jgi:hypothetical protein
MSRGIKKQDELKIAPSDLLKASDISLVMSESGFELRTAVVGQDADLEAKRKAEFVRRPSI